MWPVATYRCESWTMRKHDETKIRAFEMKCLRYVGLLRISWTEKRTNIGWSTRRKQKDSCWSRQERGNRHISDIMRKKKESLEKEILHGNMSGGSASGRPKIRWMDNIRTWTGLAMKELLRLMVENIQERGMHAEPIKTSDRGWIRTDWFPNLTRAYDNNGRCPSQKFVFGILQLLQSYSVWEKRYNGV